LKELSIQLVDLSVDEEIARTKRKRLIEEKFCALAEEESTAASLSSQWKV
jgi:hypothetical protein